MGDYLGVRVVHRSLVYMYMYLNFPTTYMYMYLSSPPLTRVTTRIYYIHVHVSLSVQHPTHQYYHIYGDLNTHKVMCIPTVQYHCGFVPNSSAYFLDYLGWLAGAHHRLAELWGPDFRESKASFKS